ncbi:unnamed protein product [Prunus brigantina]
MIYGVNEAITGIVLRRLENQGSYDILMNGFSYTTPRKACFCLVLDPLNMVLSSVFIGGVLEGQSRLKRPTWWLKRSAWWSLIGVNG